MANTTKMSNKKNNASAPVVPTPEQVLEKKVEVEPPAAPAPVKKSKKSKKEDTLSSVPVEPAASAAVVVPSVVEATTATTLEVSADAVPAAAAAVVVNDLSVSNDRVIIGLINELSVLDQQETLIQQQRKIKRRQLEKAIVKVLKANNKASAKKQKRSGNRQPSGFVRPTLISDELAAFLGKEHGTEMSRTSVTNEINNYIRQNNLKDPVNGRQINADEKLAKLLKLEKEDVLTYFNLQKFMNHHYVKKTPVVDVPVTVV